jgi:translation initiation factor IF-3
MLSWQLIRDSVTTVFHKATGLRFPGGPVITKGRFQPPARDTGKRLRVNDLIRISPILLVDENNEKAGVVDLDEAKRRAREAGLDLVEVAPQSRPPVCRIMDYGKWKYQQKKKEQKARSHSKQSELKEVRLRPKIDSHDLEIKTNRARDFLDDGDKVQFTMLFRGREMAHQEIGLNTLKEIREMLADMSKVESEPRLMGKRMTMILAPDKKAGQQNKAERPKSAAAPVLNVDDDDDDDDDEEDDDE